MGGWDHNLIRQQRQLKRLPVLTVQLRPHPRKRVRQKLPDRQISQAGMGDEGSIQLDRIPPSPVTQDRYPPVGCPVIASIASPSNSPCSVAVNGGSTSMQ